MNRYTTGFALAALGMLGLMSGIEYAGWVLFVGLLMVL